MPAVTDVNLLFGMLALQLDFITKDQLLSAMQAWVHDKAKPLGQILADQNALAIDRRQLLDALVQKHLEQHDNDPQRSLAALSSRPSARDALESLGDADVFQTLEDVRHRVSEVADPHATVAEPEGGSSRFRILRPHAKGGLGVVFVARDQEIGREVALKEIQLQHAHDPQSRARFVLEAEITGGLEHPGIVPVYGLGHYADGRPFYAMRFIRGDSLQEAVERFHAADVPGRDPAERTHALRQLLHRFIDVCNAMDYAHSKGVLHRDLKPGNIMLGKFGETLVVDWGLAKAGGRTDLSATLAGAEAPLTPTSGSGGTPTQMGSAIGTPAFMSPEQAAGRLDRLGPASDVYSLGATLYFVLTGHAAFRQPDLAEILTAVQNGAFPRPRQVTLAVPAALEAVCLKAMALEPNDRYPSAAALRKDLDDWIDDSPVSAWREPFLVKARRFLNRHRVAAGMAAAAIIVATVGLAIATGLLSNINNRLVEAGEKEKHERRRAEDQVVALFLERGQQAANNDDRYLAALDYVEALARESDPKKAMNQRTMLASLLHRTPALEWIADAKTPVRHASFSPDGSKLVLAGANGTARLVRRSDGGWIGEPLVHRGPILGAAFSPDGTRVATASADKTARIWDAATGDPLTDPIVHLGPVNQVSFDPTGKKILTAGGSSAPLLWDARTGAPLFDPSQIVTVVRLRTEDSGKQELVRSKVAILDPDQPPLVQAEYFGDKIVTISDHGLVSILAADRPYDDPRFEVFCQPRAVDATLAPDHSVLIVGCEDGEIRFFNDLRASNGTPTPAKVLRQQDDGVTTVSISPDGKRFASGGLNRNGTIAFVPVLSKPKPPPAPADKQSAERRDAPYEVAQLAEPDGKVPIPLPPTKPKLVVVPGKPSAQKTPQSAPPIRGDSEERPFSPIAPGNFSSPQPGMAVAGRAAGSRLWSTHRELVHSHTVHRVAFDVSGRFVLTASEDQSARIWRADSGEAVSPPLRHSAAVRFAAWSPDGSCVVTCGEDGQARLWTARDITMATTILEFPSEVNFVSFAGAGSNFIAANDGGEARLWNGETGAAAGPVLVHPGVIRFGMVNSEGTQLTTSCSDNKLRNWDVNVPEPRGVYSLTAALSEMAGSNFGRLLLTACDDGTMTVWNLDKSEKVVEVRDEDAPGVAGFRNDYQGRRRIGIDSKGTRFISGGMGPNFKIWDARTGRLIHNVVTGNRAIHDLDISSDGQRCFTAGTNGARVWNLDTGEPITQPMKQNGGIYSAAFSPDDLRIATAGSDGAAIVWNAKTGKQMTPGMHHDRYVHLVRFSRDGRLLLTVCANHARVWDSETGSPLTPPLRHGLDEVPWADFNSAGTHVVTGGRDGTARVWTLPPPEMRSVETLRAMLSRITCQHYSEGCQLIPRAVE